MTNLPRDFGDTRTSEITAVFNYLESLPLDLLSPKRPFLGDLRELLLDWIEPEEKMWQRLAAVFDESAPHAKNLASLASPVTLNFIKTKLEFQADVAMTKYKRVVKLYQVLALVALASMVAWRWYKPIITYPLVEVGAACLILFLGLLIILFTYHTNIYLRSNIWYIRCASLLDLATILASPSH